MQNAALDEAQAGVKTAGRNINNLRYADDTTLMAESKKELKSLLMKVKEESGKSWLKTQHSENDKHGIWSHHFMASRWGNNGNSGRLLFWLKTQHSENVTIMASSPITSWQVDGETMETVTDFYFLEFQNYCRW